jgi:hemerythrin-like domain-containing protein
MKKNKEFLMKKGTDELLKTHTLIKKLLQGFSIENDRFAEVTKTLHRAVAAHTWFEESLFHAMVRKNRAVDERFLDELVQEHKDLDRLLASLQKTPPRMKRALEAHTRQIRVILETHLTKERDALYPLSEMVLDAKTLATLAEKMESGKSAVRDLVKK